MTPTNYAYAVVGSVVTLLLSSPIPAHSSNKFHAPCPGGLKCHHGGECAIGDKDHALDHSILTSDLPWLEETNINGEHCTNCHEGWGGVDCSRKYQLCDAADPHAPTCFNGGDCFKMGLSVLTGKYEYMCDCTTAGLDENGVTKYAGKFCQHVHENKCGSEDDEMFCTNGGTCASKLDENMIQQSVCECPDHRSGPHCEFLKEEGFQDCRLDCEHGQCVKGFKSYDNLIGTGPFPAQLAFDIISDRGEHCVCPPGWTGLKCEVPARRCGPKKYCYNGATCSYDGLDVMCDCNSAHTDLVSYAGSSCEQVAETFCAPGLDQDKKDAFCTTHGKCINDPATRHMGCECEEGWSGDLCDIQAEEEQVCDLDCQNEGSCRFGVKGYKDSYDALNLPVYAKKHENGMHCACPSGFTGLKCEVDINHCHVHDSGPDDHFCLNGVPCNPDDPSFTGMNKEFSCECDNGADEVSQMLTGRFCEYAVTEYCSLDSSKHTNSFCTNNGKCKELNRRGDSRHNGCCCPEGFEGKYCQFPVGTLNLEKTTVDWSPMEECANRQEPSVPKNVYVPPDSNDTGNASIDKDWRDYDNGGEDGSSGAASPDLQEETPILAAAAPEEIDAQKNSNTGGIVSGVLASVLVAALAVVAYQKRRSKNSSKLFDAEWWTNQHTIEWWKGDPDSPIESHTNIAPAGLSRNVSVESDPGNLGSISRDWNYPEGHIMSDDDERKWEYSKDHGDLHDVVI